MKHFFRRIKRIIDYIPILWKNEDFDYGYILELLAYKLKRTREHIMEHKIIFDYAAVCDQMLEVENQIKAVQADEWMDKEFEEFYNKIGDTDMIFKWDIIKKRSPETKQEYIELLEKRYKTTEVEWEWLFHLLKDNMRNWWD